MTKGKPDNGGYLFASIALMAVGAACAWGFGGLLFAIGLWLAIACAVDEIKARA